LAGQGESAFAGSLLVGKHHQQLGNTNENMCEPARGNADAARHHQEAAASLRALGLLGVELRPTSLSMAGAYVAYLSMSFLTSTASVNCTLLLMAESPSALLNKPLM
jgi:hypothetical protein